MDYTNIQKKLIGALIGLARSVDETNADFDMFKEMVRGARMIQKEEEGLLLEQIDKIHEAKYRAVPDCSKCQNPCGRTEDYNMDALNTLAPAMKELKYALLKQIGAYAETIVYDRENYAGILEILSDALFAVGYDGFSEEQISEKIEKIKTGRQNDKGEIKI